MLRRAMQAVGAAPSKAASRGLLRLARRDHPGIRWEAITTLGMLGSLAKEAVPRLRRLAADSDQATAVRAIAALRVIEAAR